ncbi:recyclin-1 [Kwoniella mangroviensis CBS 10435]|uniref:Recyclin-1 n=1 Tax=Kwoniella mangroviensis CBS 10435 TaxID=1331196 RepID=A0A1B9J0S2_9TREE|nr:recyclin-1 [Kwoniella mangroviensis CBS 10435]
MDKWAPIAPSKPGGPSNSHNLSSRFASVIKPSKPSARGSVSSGPLVGRWPENVILRIIEFLPIPDLPSVARSNRSLARLVKDERGWEGRCKWLGLSPGNSTASPRKDSNQKTIPFQTPKKSSFSIAAKSRASIDDDFGDFSSQAQGINNNNNNDVFEDVDFGDFEAAKPNGSVAGSSKENSLLDFDDLPLPSNSKSITGGQQKTGFFALTPTPTKPKFSSSSSFSSFSATGWGNSPGPYYKSYKNHHLSMVPYCNHLRSSPSPSSTLSLLFPPNRPSSLNEQSTLLLSLLLFLSSKLQPLRDWGFLRQALLAAADRFDSTCLVAFEVSDSKKDESGMRLAAESSWKVWDAGGGSRDQWECGRVWVEKREVFYDTARWDSSENIIKVQTTTGATTRQLDFTPMDAFISHVLEAFRMDAEFAKRVFPQNARVVLSFCDRVASDVIGEYIHPLLSQARAVSQDLFLQATAATFVQAWKLVELVMEVLGNDQTTISKTQVEDTVFRMFEQHLDEYLDDETEMVKHHLEDICKTWDQQVSHPHTRQKRSHGSGPTFLTSENPDQVKRNVLAGFKDALLLPVTIVPRTVTFATNAIVTGSTQAVSGLAMLNPQKWTGSGSNGKLVKKEGAGEEGGDVVFEVPDSAEIKEKFRENDDDGDGINEKSDSSLSVPNDDNTTRTNTPNPEGPKEDNSFDKLQLLVSLDIALELIQADRDSLKRTETFAKYPGRSGLHVREAIEEIFILLLKAAGDRHISPGFRIATNQMSTYKPSEHESTTSVAPLLQFFELVHIGDTIQSMIQVYFDKELSPYVDKTDFLNAVMREKKRFESVLDDAVAAGLNAGIEVLMNQVEHIIITKTGPREYYPVEGTPLELGPTKGCQEAIKCLEMHCNLLRGSTSKEVLEVFYQEVGIRLQAILQRHLKRQIISLEGGFQIIADLNTYHAFVASLRQQRITEDFANLKMLGHVYIVSDAKDLAQIVRDVTRYGGTFTPEDIYEFIQRRSDWKKIEKTVDKAMYALSVREDCTIM